MTHFTITIKVAYEEDSIPDDMSTQLHDNVVRCIERAELLNDSDLRAVIEDYNLKVSEP